MKAEITNTFITGDLSLTLRTAIFARKRKGIWFVHLNYHQISIKYVENPLERIPLIEAGLLFQVSRDNDWISGLCLLLGAVGIVKAIIDVIELVMKALANVSSLIPKVFEWLRIEVERTNNGQEPTYLTKLNEAKFVIGLMKDGANVERRLPRWRKRDHY